MITAPWTFTNSESGFLPAFLDLVRGLSPSQLDRFLGSLLGSQTFAIMQIDNGSELGEEFSVNAIIQSKMKLFLTFRNDIHKLDITEVEDQYSKLLSREKDQTFLYLLITPENVCFEFPVGSRFAVASFPMVDLAIDEMLGDSVDVVSETEAKLMRQVKSLIRSENLSRMRELAASDKVAIVATQGFMEYECFNVFLCRSSNLFRQVSRLGCFYYDTIDVSFSKIFEIFDDVEIRRGANTGKIGELVNYLIDSEDIDMADAMGRRCSVILLSGDDSPDTFKLPHVIYHKSQEVFEEPEPFTMSHRIVSLESLKKAKYISDLK